jgi:hypothetical protein
VNALKDDRFVCFVPLRVVTRSARRRIREPATGLEPLRRAAEQADCAVVALVHLTLAWAGVAALRLVDAQSWSQMSVDGETTFTGMLEPGEEHEFTGEQEVSQMLTVLVTADQVTHVLTGRAIPTLGNLLLHVRAEGLGKRDVHRGHHGHQ